MGGYAREYPARVKSATFRSQLKASCVSSQTDELWYNETVCLWMTMYIYIYIYILLFFMFSWLAIIQKVNLRFPQTTCFICLTLISVLLVESLSLLESSLNLLCHFKNTCEWHGVIYMHLLVYSLLDVHRSFLQCSEGKDLKKWCKQKHVEKNCNGCKKLRLQLYTSKISC